MAATERMDVAILHPSITSQGGAEQVLWALAGGFEADIYAGCVRHTRRVRANAHRGYVQGDTKLRLLREARAFINPSHFESFGITTVEALLCGTPVIGRDAGHTPWLITDGVNGHLFDSTTELERLLTTFDADRLAQSRSQIRAAAIASYHPDRFMSTIQTVPHEVMQ